MVHNGWYIDRVRDYRGGWRVTRQVRPGDVAGWEGLYRGPDGRTRILSGCWEQVADEATRYASEEEARAAAMA